MEVRFENGLLNDGWLWNRFNGMLGNQEAELESGGGVPTDVVEDSEGYHFTLDLPGLKAESLEVKLEDDTLVLSAERSRPERPKDSTIRRAERFYGKIQRAFRLPEDTAHEGIKAGYKDGVLSVTVPKAPEAKPVKIAVTYNS
ncbi:MAG TPA: Hsp20/alpha crystallin family protein [Candidatus Binataceae bacterium]|jgi:HSP20 family protein